MGSRNECEGGRGHEAANDDNRQRFLDFRTRTAGEQERHEAERGDACRHHHRTEPPYGALEDDAIKRQAFVEKLVEVADENEPIEHGNAKKRDKSN